MRLPQAFADFADEGRLAAARGVSASRLYFSVGELEFEDALRGTTGNRGESTASVSFLEALAHERRNVLLTVAGLIYDLAANDRVVIVGAGGQYLLSGLPGVRRVKVVAPAEIRAQRLSAAYSLADQAARSAVDRGDREQRDYNRAIFDADWDDDLQWDLVVNTAALDAETACDAIIATTGQVGKVSAIPESVRAALALAGSINQFVRSEAALTTAWVHAVPTTEGVVVQGEAMLAAQADLVLAFAQRRGPTIPVANRLTISGRPFVGAEFPPPDSLAAAAAM